MAGKELNMHVRIDPELAEDFFVPAFLDENLKECGLARSGSAQATEYEPGKWSVSADVLNVEGRIERRVLGESFQFQSEARGLVDHINGPDEQVVVVN
jgi:hypothetical protein